MIPDSFQFNKDADTLLEENEEYFEFSWTRYRFTAFLKCTNLKCQEHAVLIGKGQEKEYNYVSPNGNYECDYVKMFFPFCCYPPPYVFHIPERTPELVAEQILSSFSIFFSDFHSAANKLRTTLELLLRHENIPQTRTHWKLETRIEILCKKYKLSKNFFSAIKLIGDEGSHGGIIAAPLSLDSILDAFELLEYLLYELYQRNKHKAHLAVLSNKIKNQYKK